HQVMLPPVWKNRLTIVVSTMLAIFVGWEIGNESMGWPVLTTMVLAGFILMRLQPLPIGTVLLGGALIGYIVGNRGFAQLSLAGNIPLLPAEFVLLVAGVTLIFQCARRHVLPIHRDLLNVAIMAWIAVSSVR